MKILFLISVHGHGRGGHFHSLNHLSKEIAHSCESRIITIGPGSSPLINNSPLFSRHIYFNGINILEAKKNISAILADFSPDVLHFFDSGSYNVCSTLIDLTHFKVVLNKCGGPNPASFPLAPSIILFSIENIEWFRSQKKFQNCKLNLIPNRVKQLSLSSAFRPINKDEDYFSIVRICRIGVFHQKSIEDSIRLTLHLHANGLFKVKLIVIGAVEDQFILTKVQEMAKPLNDSFNLISDPTLTKEASNLLYLADAVVGTGRSLMEAASLGIPLLTINSEDNLPTVIDNDTFYDAFRSNFSERCQFTNYDRSLNLSKIYRLIRDSDYRTKLSTYAKYVFDTHFDTISCVGRYLSAYDETTGSQSVRFRNFCFFLKDIYRFYRSSRKPILRTGG